MKRREAAGSSSIRTFIRGVYKAFGFWFGELKARLTRVRNESWDLVVFESGIMREAVI